MKKFYTRSGDEGMTGLLGEGRVEKFDLRMEALGTLDELSSALGVARSMLQAGADNERIVAIQRRLYDLMAEVAASPENAEKFKRITPESILELEEEIDRISMNVEVPEGFIVPGETPASAGIDLARTIARRAERRIAELIDQKGLKNKQVLVYMNRLSSLLFVMELDLIQQQPSKTPTMSKEKKK